MIKQRFVTFPGMQSTYYYYCKAQYYDTQHNRTEMAFNGPFPGGEQEAYQWGTRKYAAIPGAEFTVVKSRSRQRAVAQHETLQNIVDADEAPVDEALNIRFRHQRGAAQ